MKNYCRAILLIFSFGLAAFFCGCAASRPQSGNPPSLYRREVNQPNPGGKDLVMVFEEVQRDKATSTAKVTYKAGASVPSSMFTVRCFYDMARERQANYFIKLKEWPAPDGGTMYIVGFSQTKGVELEKYFGLKEPFADDQEPLFFPVKDYDLIFKGTR